MTLHSSKGLEFDHVFIVGCEDGTLPTIRKDGPADSPQEERRLLYVGITRARKTLMLTYCLVRGEWVGLGWVRLRCGRQRQSVQFAGCLGVLLGMGGAGRGIARTRTACTMHSSHRTRTACTMHMHAQLELEPEELC